MVISTQEVTSQQKMVHWWLLWVLECLANEPVLNLLTRLHHVYIAMTRPILLELCYWWYRGKVSGKFPRVICTCSADWTYTYLGILHSIKVNEKEEKWKITVKQPFKH